VVEQSLEIVWLMDQCTDWRNWPGSEKVELVVADALTWKTEQPVDFLYADIWPRLGTGRALPDTQAMQANVKAARVGYWGQEWDYVDFCRLAALSGRVPPSALSYRVFAGAAKLPLIEQDNPGYPHLCWAAVTLQIAARDKNKGALLQRYKDFLIGALVADPSIDPGQLIKLIQEIGK